MDKYRNFAELVKAEDAGAYRIVALSRGSAVAVIAPHAGAIEAGSSELARAIAGPELSLYLCEGRKADGNKDLHITSTNFDEPQGLKLVGESDVAIALHGEASTDKSVVYMGGAHRELRKVLTGHLQGAGFEVGEHENEALQGTHPENICNRGRSGAGVQLELSRALRLEFFRSLTPKGKAAPSERFHDFVRAVRRGLELDYPDSVDKPRFY